MPESQSPQGDKTRRPRPFGSFLLFLTVLVVVLFAFGSDALTGPGKWTEDRFWWELHTGGVQTVKLKGENEVVGIARNGEHFVTSLADMKAREHEIQQESAKGIPAEVTVTDLTRLMDEGVFSPELHRHLIRLDSTPIPSDRTSEEGGEPVAHKTKQEDRLVVRGTAADYDLWRNAGLVNLAAEVGLEPGAGSRLMWLDVKDAPDLAAIKSRLTAMGSQVSTLSFDPVGGLTHGKSDPTFGLILLTWGPWILIFGVFMLFMRQMRNQGSGAGVMSFGRSRAQLYSKEDHTNTTFDDVAGATEAKDEVREVVEFLKNPGRFTRIGGRIPRGVLLVGPPGCGKTLLAKAIAGEAEVPFYSISGSDFVEMFVGVGASRVRDLFKQARENSPCIIFLDEIDAVGRRRGSGMGGGHDEREQTLNAILVEMDGFGTDEGIIVVAATNRPDVLDPALLRPGRFDREVAIDLPDMEGRLQILNVHLKKVKVTEEVDVKALSRSTPGYSGADLAAIVNEAAIMAVLDHCEQIEMQHLEEATAKVRYGRKKTSQKIEEEDLEITAYHEAGHTIVAAKIDDVDMPHKVTIVPRGRALGSTMMLPEKESYHMQRRRLLGQLAMAFGGRVAEEIFVGDISAGAADDIRRATELAKAMVTELGMSEKVGPINYAERQGSDFLGTELMASKWHSEETARVIDEEIERILRAAYKTAEQLIEKERPAVERLTRALLMHETLDAGEIQRLIQGTSPEDLRPKKVETPEPVAEEAPHPAPTEAENGSGDNLGGLSGEAGLSPA
jgi:cell division protease FtsH